LLGKLAQVGLTLLNLLGSQSGWQQMDAILFQCRDVCGVDVALTYASNFKRFEALTQFVYDGGQRYHNGLYHHIDK